MFPNPKYVPARIANLANLACGVYLKPGMETDVIHLPASSIDFGRVSGPRAISMAIYYTKISFPSRNSPEPETIQP